MKLSRILLQLALAGALSGTSSVYAQFPGAPGKSISDGSIDTPQNFVGTGRVIGDQSAQTIGDEPATIGDDAPGLPPRNLDGTRTLTSFDEGEAAAPAIQPIPVDTAPPPAQHVVTHSHSSGNCDIGSSSCDFRAATCAPEYWLTAETLLWFADGRQSPPLVTTAATGVLPVAGDPGVNVVFGGANELSAGVLPGYRFQFGKWLDDAQTLGVGGRVYGIFSAEDSFNSAAGGTQSVGRPFFNTFLPGEDARLVNFTENPNSFITGSIDASSELSMVGAEALVRVLLTKAPGHRVDLIGGYVFNRLDDSLTINSVSRDFIQNNFIADGTIFDRRDAFSTKNTFHGGQLGLQSEIGKGRIFVSSLAKVAFGNMHQEVNISGTTITTDPNLGPTQTNGGVLAQPSNSVNVNRDRFAFLPEFGMKLGYGFRPNLNLTVGYTFMYWSDVALAGAQIDRNVDLLQNTNNPTFTFRESGFWMQGVDLGLTYSF